MTRVCSLHTANSMQSKHSPRDRKVEFHASAPVDSQCDVDMSTQAAEHGQTLIITAQVQIALPQSGIIASSQRRVVMPSVLRRSVVADGSASVVPVGFIGTN